MANMVEQDTGVREIVDGYTTLWPISTQPLNMGQAIPSLITSPHGDHLMPHEALNMLSGHGREGLEVHQHLWT